MSYGYSSFALGKMGATSEYAGFITYFIGVIAMFGEYSLAVMVAIFLLLLLSAKEYFKKLKMRFSREELGDSLKFAVIALVILPLLPDAKFSILEMVNWVYSGGMTWTHPVLTAKFFNPYGTWFFVVIMAGVEYAGYLLSRMIGTKGGIMLSGAIGGLISSTATTVAMTRKSTEKSQHRNSYVVATLLASCIMFIRVVLVAFVIYPPILTTILFPASVMFMGLLAMTGFIFFQARKEVSTKEIETETKEYESPFQLLPAIQFAGLIVIIKFLSVIGKSYSHIIPPEIYNYGLALISGLADVDAINMAYSTGARSGDFTLVIAATTILIAVMSNNVVKASIAYRFGESGYGKKVLLGFGVSIIAGILALLFVNLILPVSAAYFG